MLPTRWAGWSYVEGLHHVQGACSQGCYIVITYSVVPMHAFVHRLLEAPSSGIFLFAKTRTHKCVTSIDNVKSRYSVIFNLFFSG